MSGAKRTLHPADRYVPWSQAIKWPLVPLSKVASLNPVTLSETTDPLTQLRYIDIGSVDSKGKVTEPTKLIFEEAPSRARRVLAPGDTIFSTVRTYLKAVAYIDHAEPGMVCSTGFAVLRPNHLVYPKFLFYWIRSDNFVDEVCARSIGVSYPAVRPSEIGHLPALNLSIVVQRTISDFLDRKTAAIDALIAKKERIVELLAEECQSLITRAVTKGLNANVPLKYSGLPWLGDIPAHWSVKRMSYIAVALQTGPFGSQLHTSDYLEGGTPLVNPSHIVDGRIEPDLKCAVGEEKLATLRRHKLRAGDIVFARRGELGRCAVVTEREEGWLCGTGSIRIVLDKSHAAPFFVAQAASLSGSRDWLQIESVGATMDNLNASIVGGLPLPFPPLSEQLETVKYIQSLARVTDTIRSQMERSLSALREYRQALITSAVTGQIEVPVSSRKAA